MNFCMHRRKQGPLSEFLNLGSISADQTWKRYTPQVHNCVSCGCVNQKLTYVLLSMATMLLPAVLRVLALLCHYSYNLHSSQSRFLFLPLSFSFPFFFSYLNTPLMIVVFRVGCDTHNLPALLQQHQQRVAAAGHGCWQAIPCLRC